MSRTAANFVLIVILIAYLSIGAAFAIQTPAWQAPDEPAHYNYIKSIAVGQELPVLKFGDYNQAYNEDFTRTPHSTATQSIDPLRYENYAPPLYYLLAAPVYALTDGWIVALRLFSVILGGGLVVVAYLCAAEVFPDQLQLALGTAAFVAFVPQHLAMLSAVNNDSLSELLIALVLLQCLRLFRSNEISKRRLIGLGVTLGLGLLTKSTFYYTAIPIAFVAILLHTRKRRDRAKPFLSLAIRHLSFAFIPAVLIAAPMWLRNLSVYGGLDVMGLARHNAVVVGQPTTAQWIIDHGVGGLLQHFFTTTYQSFWGQFGWMAVPMPDREYLLLGALSVIAFIGWGWWLIGRIKDAQSSGHRQGGMRKLMSPFAIMLTLLFLLTVGGYLYYNLTFVQHQGRYLFPALIPIGLAFSIGWDYMLGRIKIILLKLTARSQRDWTPWLDEAQLILFALVFIYLARLDLIALQRYILPNLSA
jgi:4-amino-4-deoxy-L-arabinose transferase-like glycosyltransferase